MWDGVLWLMRTCRYVKMVAGAIAFLGNQFEIKGANPVARSGLDASCRARALPLKLFQATVLAFPQPAGLSILDCGR